MTFLLTDYKNPVLTYRNGIGGRLRWVSKHIIVTTNKNPDQWAELLDDEVLTTAILDRLLYNCEIIKLSGKSYRLDNRKTIFENTVL